MKTNKEMSDLARKVMQSGVKPITIKFKYSPKVPADLGVVRILNPRKALGLANYGLNPAITVSINSGISYGDFLNDMMVNPFKVKYVYIYASGGESQLIEPLYVQAKDVTGKSNSFSINPVVDPYQNRGSVLFTDEPFVMDKDTAMYLNSFPTNTTFSMSFYPDTEYQTGVVTPKVVKAFKSINGEDINYDGTVENIDEKVNVNKITEPCECGKNLVTMAILTALAYLVFKKTL